MLGNIGEVSMDITFNCEHCGQLLIIDGAVAGATVECPKCRNELTVPSPGIEEPSAGPRSEVEGSATEAASAPPLSEAPVPPVSHSNLSEQMNETSPTIIDLSLRAGELARTMSVHAGLPQNSPMIFGMATGFDIAITLFEQSTGAVFGGLTPESAARVVQYFRDEAARNAPVDPHVALFYQSWADTLTATYLQR
jgi:phage FluMu protein Com